MNVGFERGFLNSPERYKPQIKKMAKCRRTETCRHHFEGFQNWNFCNILIENWNWNFFVLFKKHYFYFYSQGFKFILCFLCAFYFAVNNSFCPVKSSIMRAKIMMEKSFWLDLDSLKSFNELYISSGIKKFSLTKMQLKGIEESAQKRGM